MLSRSFSTEHHCLGAVAMPAPFGLLLLVLVALVEWSGPAIAETPVDLDAEPPEELIDTKDGVSRVLYWSIENGQWLELFRTDGTGRPPSAGPG